MPRRNPLRGFSTTLRSYPPQFLVLTAATFIDVVGGALLFPFFSLYVTARFGVGMTEVGLLFTGYSLGHLVGSTVGGALADRVGRKGVLIFSLVATSLGSVAMGLLDSYAFFLASSWLVGIVESAGNPARQAMVADLLPEKRRSEGFAVLRVIINLAVSVGPVIGGLLASRSYLLLFVGDAVMSLITALVVLLVMRETKPAVSGPRKQENGHGVPGGYLRVLRDSAFLLFIGAYALPALIAVQATSTLGVYLRDNHGVSNQGFGYIISLNPAMVVLFQFSITRAVSRFRPFAVLAVGTLLYGIGFAMYGFVSGYALFLVAMATLTVGEMMTAPTAQSVAARYAPEDMRGRYMAVFGYARVLTSTVGPLFAGLLMDNGDPRWLWYACGLLGLIGAGAFMWLRGGGEKAAMGSGSAA